LSKGREEVAVAVIRYNRETVSCLNPEGKAKRLLCFDIAFCLFTNLIKSSSHDNQTDEENHRRSEKEMRCKMNVDVVMHCCLLCSKDLPPLTSKKKPRHGEFRFRHKENSEWNGLCVIIPASMKISKAYLECIFQHEDFEFVARRFLCETNGIRKCLGVPSSVCLARYVLPSVIVEIHVEEWLKSLGCG
jgi:hypothetical protein